MDLNVLIVGGGIHGVGVLHDLATRGIEGLLLVERRQLASGTSSRTTKLLHGGLRYLEHPLQWGLVREALRERTILLENLPGIIQPLRFVLPTFKGGRPAWIIQSGLRLYDLLANSSSLPRSSRLAASELTRLAPYLRQDTDGPTGAFLYHDAQMLDDVLVRVVARAAMRCRATYREGTVAEEIRPVAGGFRVSLRSGDSQQQLSCRMVVNAAGAWASANLLRWGYQPRITCLLNVGSHLVLSPEVVSVPASQCAATLLQHDDGRVVFFIPWDGQWLLGTTDSPLDGTPDRFGCPDGDRDYLLRIAARHLALHQPERHVTELFCGIRTIPVSPVSGWGTRFAQPATDSRPDELFGSPYYLRRWSRKMSALSREAVLDWSIPSLVSIYGGKFTTYRSLSERVGDYVAGHLGNHRPSGTRHRKNWFLEDLAAETDLLMSRASLRRL